MLKIQIKTKKWHPEMLRLIKIGDWVECLPGGMEGVSDNNGGPGVGYEPGLKYEVTSIGNAFNTDPEKIIFFGSPIRPESGVFGKYIRKIVK